MSLGLVFHTPQSPHKGVTSTSEGLQVSGGGLNSVPKIHIHPEPQNMTLEIGSLQM